MPATPEISIVIPAYNEASRITQTLRTLREYLEQNGWDAEVLVVNDGSEDDTAAIVEQIHRQWDRVRLLHNPGNWGKGYAVKNGVLRAQGDIVLFTDADLSAPIQEMPKLIDPILAGECELCFGSRAIDRSLIGMHQSKLREFSGRIYNLFVQALTGLRFKDTQCGFKAFRREPMVPVFERQRILGFGFDPELLYIAKKRGLRMKEVPVRWNHVQGTKVDFLKDSVSMLLDLVRIRWNDGMGRYG